MKNSFIDLFFSKSYLNRINNKIKKMGITYKSDINKLLFKHLLITFLVFIALYFIIKNSLITSIIIAIAYFTLTEYLYFDYRLYKRSKKLEKDAIFFFQILSLTLESGNNLKNAIELTSNSMDNSLALEFRKVIDDISLGKSLTESLNDLKERIPSDTINNIILNLLESNIYGSNMIESLNNQISYLNDKIVLETKARINKMPVKISIISVVIFVPLILLIILTPIIIKLLGL